MHNYSFRVVFITGTFTHIIVNTYIHIVFYIMTLCSYTVDACSEFRGIFCIHHWGWNLQCKECRKYDPL